MGLRSWAESFLELPAREAAPTSTPAEIVGALGPVLAEFAAAYKVVHDEGDYAGDNRAALAAGMSDLLSGVGARLRKGR